MCQSDIHQDVFPLQDREFPLSCLSCTERYSSCVCVKADTTVEIQQTCHEFSVGMFYPKMKGTPEYIVLKRISSLGDGFQHFCLVNFHPKPCKDDSIMAIGIHGATPLFDSNKRKRPFGIRKYKPGRSWSSSHNN